MRGEAPTTINEKRATGEVGVLGVGCGDKRRRRARGRVVLRGSGGGQQDGCWGGRAQNANKNDSGKPLGLGDPAREEKGRTGGLWCWGVGGWGGGPEPRGEELN